MGCCLSTSSNDDSTREDIQTLQRSTSTPIDRRDSIRTSNSIRSHALDSDGLPLSERKSAPLRKHIWRAKGDMAKRVRIFRMREEFYDTRVGGRPEVWNALQYSINLMEDGDLVTAQEILRAGGITVPTGDLTEGAFDQSGQRYDLPSYCCSLPINVIDAPDEELSEKNITKDELDEVVQGDNGLEHQREAKGKGPAVTLGGKKKLRARLSDRSTDLIVRFDDEDTVRVISRKIIVQAGLISNRDKVRIAYLGKILKDTETLSDQGWNEEHILNVFVLKRE